MMFKKEISRAEIEEKLSKSGDYVKMDFLSACLKKQLNFDTKKFVLVTLSQLYESRKIYLEAAKLIKVSADINTTFKGKMDDFVKSADLFIKAGDFDEADASFNKALALGSTQEKVFVKNLKRDYYKAQAKIYLQQDKRANAVKLYERLLSLDLAVDEKKEIQKTLLELYQRLGKIMEYSALQKSIS